MDSTILQGALRKLEEGFIARVFPGRGVCFARAANALFAALVRGGSPLVRRMAPFVGGKASRKGTMERISGWLGKYDFAEGAASWMLDTFAPSVGETTAVAVDFSDISKEFGGKGMEGMAKGWDGSRHTAAMGHTFCAACAVEAGGTPSAPCTSALRRGASRWAGG